MTDAGYVDRAGWPPGPWDNEPDRLEWRLPELPGYALLVTRNLVLGNLCGYVAVPPGHPLHGKSLQDLGGLDAHGGVTYAAACAGVICHVPEPGEPDDVWWIGFDCAHCLDALPGRPRLAAFGGTYRDLEYVKAEVEWLARQLGKADRL